MPLFTDSTRGQFSLVVAMSVVGSLRQSVCLSYCTLSQMTNDAKFIYKYLLYIVNPEGLQNCMMGSKVTAKLMAKIVFFNPFCLTLLPFTKLKSQTERLQKES